MLGFLKSAFSSLCLCAGACPDRVGVANPLNPCSSVSIRGYNLSSMLKTIHLSLGSNLGDRAAHISRGLELLAAVRVKITRCSSLYATEPVGFGPQRWFLNCCVAAETSLLPRQLLHATQSVEHQLGRRRIVPFGPRSIDIDILFYASAIIHSRDLVIPHPRLADRRFVLVPLAEIAPSLHHPVLQHTIARLLAETPDRNHVVRWQLNPSPKSKERP